MTTCTVGGPPLQFASDVAGARVDHTDRNPLAGSPDGQGEIRVSLHRPVEVERVPSTMSVLASYRVDTDVRGDLISYERLHRFTRITADG